jgi:hypothetical protein
MSNFSHVYQRLLMQPFDQALGAFPQIAGCAKPLEITDTVPASLRQRNHVVKVLRASLDIDPAIWIGTAAVLVHQKLFQLFLRVRACRAALQCLAISRRQNNRFVVGAFVSRYSLP